VTNAAVLWDMDGVLVDTGEFHYQSWAQVLQDYDVPFSREVFRGTFGMNNAGILSVLL
jgi:beta-phosphoglucomutase